MIPIALRSLWAHKRRLLATVAAVTIGVAFLAGTLVLGDTTRASFDAIFERVNARTDVVVKPATPPVEDGSGTVATAVLDERLAERVAAVDGVERARPAVAGVGLLIGHDGEPLGGSGPPTIAASWLDDPALDPYRLAEGDAPVTDTDVVIDKASAAAGGLHIGDTATVQTPEPVQVTITGLVTFGDQESAGGTTYVGFTLAGAQRNVLHQPGRVSTIVVAGDQGVTQTELARRVSAVLPPGAEAITGAQLSQNQRSAIDQDFLDFFNWFLLIFAGIALLVATFSIYNTFSILAAQRTRESALLRALGASRRQVMGASLVEMLVVGLCSSAVGLVGGLGLAAGLRALLGALGADLPASGLVLAGRTVAITMAVGVVVTLLAGLLPARRSSRIAPLAALRDIAVDTSAASLARLATGAVLLAAGGAVLLHAAIGGGDAVLARAATGAVAGLAGMVALGPATVTLLSPAIGWPLAARGTSGRLALENARRSPRRTSAAATALLIGVAVVTVFTVMAQSAKASVEQTLTDAFGGDLVVSAGGAGLAPALAGELGAEPGIGTATGLGTGAALLDGHDGPLRFSSVDPGALSRVLDLRVTEGSLGDLGDHQLAVSSETAEEQGWHLGSPVPLRFLDGATGGFTVGAVYEVDSVVGGVLMRREDWSPHAVQPSDAAVLVRLADGVTMAEGRATAERVAAPYAGAKVRDRDEYVASIGSEINQALTLVYAMLALAVVIALMGIANTLSLSIHERVRELGLLRAVGQTRRQVRAMVRGESVVISLFGTLSGVALGVFLGWALVRAAATEEFGTFSAAPAQLVAITVVGGLAGVLAALRPARRAARLDILTAIAAE